mgnify:FL=1
MKKFSTWMLVMFMVLFWLLRIVIALAYELKWNFAGLVPLNQSMEIALLFVFLLCLILIVKRKMIGALLYLLTYGMYFGTNVTSNIQTILDVANGTTDISQYLNLFMSVIGIILPIAVLLDLLWDRERKENPKDKKTDWFYKNQKFDREMDERADKNNYRNY